MNNQGSHEVVIGFNDLQHFLDVLKINPGVIIVRFSATWCAPCKKIKNYVYSKFARCDSNIVCCDLDVDDNTELYSFFKKSRQVNGIPVLLAFFKGNVTMRSNESITGTNTESIDYFFDKCNQFATSVNANTK